MNLAVSVRSEYSIVKSMVFTVVIYGYKIWGVKKAEH